jgi:peptide-methionine (S)-S-oxide reductase
MADLISNAFSQIPNIPNLGIFVPPPLARRYTGGKQKNPTYQNIMDSTEAYMVEFDPSIVSYEKILDAWADQLAPFYPSNCQYRSAIFYSGEEQLHAAVRKIDELSRGGQRKVYVDLEQVSAFYRAEEYHQDFLEKHMSSNRI